MTAAKTQDTSAIGRIGVEGAAQYLQVSKWHVYHLSASRLLPHFKVGRRLEFEIGDLEAFRQSKKRGG